MEAGGRGRREGKKEGEEEGEKDGQGRDRNVSPGFTSESGFFDTFFQLMTAKGGNSAFITFGFS